MEQMINREVPVTARVLYGNIESGLMRDRAGRIFLLRPYGKELLAWPVLEDGTLGKAADLNLTIILSRDNEEVEMVSGKSLGITEEQIARY